MARRSIAVSLFTLAMLFVLSAAQLAWSQQAQGTVNVTVLDQSGAVVTGAELKLVDLATNDARQATTQEAGNYAFVNLNFGQYKLTVTKQGFEPQSYSVLVQTARTTDVRAVLKVGAATTAVEVVGGAAPLVETSSNATNITIDTKQLEDLPLGGRNIQQLATLTAGYNGAYNGLPYMAQGATVDGVLGNTGRWKYGTTGTLGSAIQPRLESIAEMTVSMDQLDMNQGWGTSNMQLTYVTRRGTNQWHGRFYEDHRNSALNAYNWGSTQKSKYHLNEFGASVGGPVIKDKLFFFVNYSEFKQPGGSLVTRQYFTDAAKTGVFTYGPRTNPVTVNLFNVIAAYNAANNTSFPTTLNSAVAARIAQVDQFRTSKGGPVPSASAPSDLNVNAWMWQNLQPTTNYYPTFRVDYNLSQSQRLNFAFNQTKTGTLYSNAEHWPGDKRAASNKGNTFTGSLGYEWTVSSTLINKLNFGYTYTAAWFGYDAPTDFFTGQEVWYNYAGGTTNVNLDDYYELPNSRMQPVFSLSDNMSWAKGSHFFSFGINAWRDQNKYWDPPEGYVQISLGLNAQDPVSNALAQSAIQSASSNPSATMTQAEWTNARQLYATLAGRISRYYGRHAYDPKTGKYATDVAFSTLNELEKSWGLSFQDSYKMRRNLTINYGLRWDFVSPDKDLTGKYHTLSNQDLWGPTAIGALFQPGQALTGSFNPQWVVTPQPYDSWNVTPQPALGIAWTPRNSGTFLEKLMGGEKTVVRLGYSFRRFTEPQQFIWDFGTNYATGFYQIFQASPGTSNGGGFFTAGSLKLGDPVPTSVFTWVPPTYQTSIPVSASTFGSLTVNSIKDGIRQPYTQSWNIGFQRELGQSRALEVRYNGNRTIRQWIAPNINEVNIFENGFLTEFTNAKKNLDVCLANQALCKAAAGVTSSGTYSSFRNWGLAGQVNVPLMTAAAGTTKPNDFFTNTTYVNRLINGQAGSFANGLQTTKDYFCRMVGSTFSPCGTTYGAGAGYPINFFVANPFAAPASAQMLTDAGYSNYNALQMELRQRSWHGVSATANYTWSRTLGLAATDWYAGMSQLTIRDAMRSSYVPLMGDRNHVIHISSTYDLPVGKGKQFLNRGGIVDKVLGGWTTSTIITFQTGNAYRISGNNNTVTNSYDGGIVLNGVSKSDILSHQGLFFDSAGKPYFLDPNWVSTIKANNSITAENTPGVWGTMLWLHGPHQTYADIGISKAVSFTERIRFKFQTEMTNAFNHPIFSQSTTGIASTTFGQGQLTSPVGYAGGYNPRRIEFRANLEF